ncbi:CRISPR-associated protein [bacterium BMS3Abin13]|nr:CRISPR-associated protein [bacterium BMS3Abin13]
MKNIMLAVVGLNPQVITEALYGLYHAGRRVDSIHLITTRAGKDRIFTHLLSPYDGKMAAFMKEYNIDQAAIDCGPHTVHVLKKQSGVEIDDIVDEDDNEILINTCLKLAFQFTGRPDCAVFFLVAGGRKTMTSCLTLAAQLYGRPQDRIYHVLITPEFESSRDFWYPPKISRPVTLFDKERKPYVRETKYAAINLINIPFVSVRERFSADLLSTPHTPADLMAALIQDDPKMLLIRLAEGKIVFGGREMDMYPAHMALYGFFAEIKKNCTQEHNCRDCTDCFVDTSRIFSGQDKISRIYSQVARPKQFDEMSATGITALDQENFNSYKSKIRKSMIRRFGNGLAINLEISATGERPLTRYGIRLDKSRIRIEW